MTKPLSPTDLKRLHRTWRRETDLRMGMILDGVQNPYNLGAILRSAAAYQVERLWTAPPTLPIDHPKVAKTALGCDRLVDVVNTPSGPEAVAAAGEAGLTVVAVELTADAVPMFDLELGPAVCLVVGHEERGVHTKTLDAVDRVAFLPQLGKVGSLNVAHAATAALYETARQHWSARP